MPFLTFLFILFIIFVLPKFIRGFLLMYRLRKQARRMYEQMYGAQQRAEEPRRRKAGWSQPIPHRKKIDSSVGEYVRFQEIETAETVAEHTDAKENTTTTVAVEQQITDAEWEEIS
ncbi:MAG: hypothetical protein K2J06_01955 [Muribaculaceae bacterium]|nr:hypothetical protein [Muribaculaceae bacterium]